MDSRDANIILALAGNRMNVSDAARKLYMHRNTVIYHINKVKKRTGFDPLDFYDLVKLVIVARSVLGEEA